MKQIHWLLWELLQGNWSKHDTGQNKIKELENPSVVTHTHTHTCKHTQSKIQLGIAIKESHV